MARKKEKNSKRKSRPAPQPSALLDVFTERDIETWETRSTQLHSYYDRVYFDLERQRAGHYEELCAALRAVASVAVSLDEWVRVTDWRWNLRPLSPAGSLKGIGGRFNIGSDLDRARGQAFPCLYLAHDVETAYREYFGGPLCSRSGKLTLGEFALRRETSFTTFCLRGQLEQVLDLRDHRSLASFAKIIGRFGVSNDTNALARRARLRPHALIKSSLGLWARLLVAPQEWRLEPQMWGIPSASQIFGRFVRDAGFDAVLYPSQQGGSLCVAVFPENFRASASRVEVVGAVPPGASCTVLDKENLCLEFSA